MAVCQARHFGGGDAVLVVAAPTPNVRTIEIGGGSGRGGAGKTIDLERA